MSECCKDLFTTLEKYELDVPEFTKEDLLTVVSFILSWQHRCIFRDQLNLSRFEDQLQNLLSCAIKNVSRSPSKTNEEQEETWSELERERLFVCVGKIFQLHFPFYQARSIPLVRQDITAKDCNKYCDVNDGEVPEALLINIAYFCEKGGLSIICDVFQDNGPDTLPFSLAHLLVTVVTQLRVWFSVQAIVQYIVPLRGPVIRYLCKLSDKDLRQPDGRTTMADTMWSAVKAPVESGPMFDRDSMDLAFKYFTSSTLTIRLTGLSQIANQVHMFMDLFQANTLGEIDSMCTELSQWLLDNNIVEHLFGPNLHVELVKQSQIILNYLAQEACVTSQHLDCIWTAAQLKHASRYVHDLLTVLTKHLDMSSILYLLEQVSHMQPAAHTKQTLYLASVLLRIIWNAGLSAGKAGHTSVHVTSPEHGPLPASVTSAGVSAALQRKFQHGDSMSQSSSRSGSMSDISFDAEQRDMDESPTPRKFTNLPPDGLDIEEAPTPVLPVYRNPAEPYTGCNKATEEADIDSTSCTNSHGSSLSERRDLDDFDGDDMEDDLTQLKAVVALRSVQEGDAPKSFDLNTVCEEGKTLLWDLLQDKNAIHLEDGLIQEIEKLLCQLICYTGDKRIRMKFIEGCLDNLAHNRSIVMSIQLLPKLLSSFQQYVNNSYGPHCVTKHVTSELSMMDLFFNNLVLYMENVNSNTRPPCALYSHTEEVQTRLQFLSSIYSNELSRPEFSLSVDQVDVLWSTLVGDTPCCDEALEWFVHQVQGKDLHALNNEVLKYIFIEKLPSLPPESFSMTGLTLLQQLYQMFKHPVVKSDNTAKVYGIDQVWNIAVQASSPEVSMAAINYLNSLYINAEGGSLKYEEEFVTRCMDSIRMAATSLTLENQDMGLQIMERGISLLKSHIEMFKRRFAFHLRLWLLEGHGITRHRQKQQRPSEKHFPIRVMCQPAGLSDKGTFEMYSSDLVSELRAEVTYWCKKLQEKIQGDGHPPESASGVQHTPISPFSPQLHPPFRLISQGHELTPDLDEKSLAEVGFKDLQLVFVSVGANKRDRYYDGSQVPSSALPAPAWETAPMVILLQEQHLETIFSFLEILDELNALARSSESPSDQITEESDAVLDDKSPTHGKGSEIRYSYPCSRAGTGEEEFIEESIKTFQESHAEFLCQLIWELLCILPTNPTILSRLKYFGRNLTSESYTKMDTSKPEEEKKEPSYEGFAVPWEGLLDPKFPHKLLYCLQVIDLIHRTVDDPHNSSHDSNSSSDSESSGVEDDTEMTSKPSHETWGSQFVEFGGLRHLYDILMSGRLESKLGNPWTPWQQECLAYLLKLICEFGTIKQEDEDDEVFSESEETQASLQRRDGQFRVRYKSTDKEEMICIKCLSQQLMSMVEVEPLLDKLLSISHQSTLQYNTGPHKALRGGEVVHHAVSLMVSWAYTDTRVSKALLQHKNFRPWLQQLVLLAREPVVRFEACCGLYRLSLIKENSCLIQLMDSLLDSLPLARSLQSRSSIQSRHDPCTREYFSLLCRLVDGLPSVDGNKVYDIDLNSLAKLLSQYIISSKANQQGQSRSHHEEDGVGGMLKLCTAVMRHNPPFKFSQEGLELIGEVFGSFLFDLPSDCYDKRKLPLCKLKSVRSAAYDLLLELAKDSRENFCELQKLLMNHHKPGMARITSTKKHTSYGWHYWPHDNERAPCGLVGIINLGATCYMASCIQQLFMMPQARESILNAKMTGDPKNDHFLRELQKMFCFLMLSERKAYNPRSFCRTYTMDKQLLNTGEQKDMTEFFTDLISKLEEMSPSLRDLVRELFCGVITNNVVSLDCSHVSKNKEEFYSVRCTVADMKNLYESLDEVTIKDTLDGDNMYTCSQCGKKVRAEKRACFTVLPRILCFNTMRYTFNMVTMMKEKVNTHFSFPLQLNMAPYSEDYLMGDKVDEDADKDPNYCYNLIGVVVHTGTAEGGHYYSFIRNRSCPQQDRWFLFNDAEVKPFDPSQIAGECFGGEMTTKTYDVVSEKFMDLSFEKTHSAYMLFYERADTLTLEVPEPNITLSPDLADWIWRDNIQFLHDKHIFDTTYFNFMWFLCSSLPPTLQDQEDVFLSNMQLGTSFLLETLVHSKEKLLLKNWSELLIHHLEHDSEACTWFVDALSTEDWWLQKLLIKSPVQSIRQMFARLCAHAFQALRQFYCRAVEENNEDGLENKLFSHATRFIKAILKLLEYSVTRIHIKNLSEYFWLIHQFTLSGEEERAYLLSIDAISALVSFYLGSKAPETPHEAGPEDEEDPDDDDDEVVPILPEDKYRVSSLEKMISIIAVLVEESWNDRRLHLSENDLEAVIGAEGFPFLFQAIKDNINLRHTTNLVLSLCRYNSKLAENVVSMVISAVQKLPPEQSQSFFKLLSMLTELQGSAPGMPPFTTLTLNKIWEAAEYNAMLCIEWLTCTAPKNRMAHQWVLDNMDKWVEKYLVADNSLRIRNASAYLLIALVPSNHFRQGFRPRSFSTPHKDLQLSEDAKNVLHKIYIVLLDLLPNARKYCDRTIQGTTKLVSYFVVMNYCLVSRKEKEMFTPYCMDLWKLFHPLMSEPNISVHHNKQALLIFWYHVCMECEENIAFITDNPPVANNIALNYILSSDEPDVIQFNRNVLPAYYGLLRLCCENSRTFTRQLASHSNMKWAFENLTTRVKHYPQAIDELFSLMRLFSGYGATDLSSEEKLATASFRKNTILLYLNCLDGVSNWTTLITAFKVLLQTEQDRLILLINQGLLILSDAFSNLHMMYHEATACHVTGDLTEILQILRDVLLSAHTHLQSKESNTEVRSSIIGWSERIVVAQKLLSLLNSYTPQDVHGSCLEVLSAMLHHYPVDFVEHLIPTIHMSHRNWHQGSQQAILGPYFPRRHTKVIGSSKSLPRPAVPDLNMFLHASYLEVPKGVDEAYDKAVLDYFHSYHFFVDKVIRVAFNQDRVSDTVISCACLLAIESIPLHMTFFCKLWMEVYHNATEHVKCKECIQQLCQRQELVEYIDLLLLDERESLNLHDIYTFLCCFFPRVHTRALQGGQWKGLVHTLVATVIADRPVAKNANDTELLQMARRLTADLRAMALLFSVSAPQKSDISSLLKPSMEDIMAICRQFQAKKKARQEKKSASITEESSEDGDSNESGDSGPKTKRRRTLSDESSGVSDRAGPSGEGSKDSKESEGGEEQTRPKPHPLFGNRPPPDWVDHLAKALQSLLNKLSK